MGVTEDRPTKLKMVNQNVTTDEDPNWLLEEEDQQAEAGEPESETPKSRGIEWTNDEDEAVRYQHSSGTGTSSSEMEQEEGRIDSENPQGSAQFSADEQEGGQDESREIRETEAEITHGRVRYEKRFEGSPTEEEIKKWAREAYGLPRECPIRATQEPGNPKKEAQQKGLGKQKRSYRMRREYPDNRTIEIQVGAGGSQLKAYPADAWWNEADLIAQMRNWTGVPEEWDGGVRVTDRAGREQPLIIRIHLLGLAPAGYLATPDNGAERRLRVGACQVPES
jgi:hypothetical protein